jgi:hypothetical protein
MSSSELAVVAAEIVDILPREHQTTEMSEWVEGQLANGNTASEMLEYCKQQFGIVVHKIEACELRIEQQGIRLNSYIEKTDCQFDQVHSKIAKLETDLAVTTALSNERSQQQQFTNGQLMSSINNTNTNLTNGLTNVSNKSHGGSDTNYATLAFGLAFGVIVISCMAAIASKVASPPSQVIEYKNVPSNGFPRPVPKELYDQL